MDELATWMWIVLLPFHLALLMLTNVWGWQGQDRARLASAIFFTSYSFEFTMQATVDLQGHRWILGGLRLLFAAAMAYVAQREWDDWRRRRKKRPVRARGRIALRLGRLVIIPEA